MPPRSRAALLAVIGLLAAAPAWATTETFTAAKDTYVWNVAGAYNLGAQTVAETGRAAGKGSVAQVKRALLHFDVTALPANAIISTATLRL